MAGKSATPESCPWVRLTIEWQLTGSLLAFNGSPTLPCDWFLNNTRGSRIVKIKDVPGLNEQQIVVVQRDKFFAFLQLVKNFQAVAEAGKLRSASGFVAEGNFAILYGGDPLTKTDILAKAFSKYTAKSYDNNNAMFPLSEGVLEKRIHCTEFQLINAFAEFRNNEKSAESCELTIYTERFPCYSCADLIARFVAQCEIPTLTVIYSIDEEQKSQTQQHLMVNSRIKLKRVVRLKEALAPPAFQIGKRYVFLRDDAEVTFIYQGLDQAIGASCWIDCSADDGSILHGIEKKPAYTLMSGEGGEVVSGTLAFLMQEYVGGI